MKNRTANKRAKPVVRSNTIPPRYFIVTQDGHDVTTGVPWNDDYKEVIAPRRIYNAGYGATFEEAAKEAFERFLRERDEARRRSKPLPQAFQVRKEKNGVTSTLLRVVAF